MRQSHNSRLIIQITMIASHLFHSPYLKVLLCHHTISQSLFFSHRLVLITQTNCSASLPHFPWLFPLSPQQLPLLCPSTLEPCLTSLTSCPRRALSAPVLCLWREPLRLRPGWRHRCWRGPRLFVWLYVLRRLFGWVSQCQIGEDQRILRKKGSRREWEKA